MIEIWPRLIAHLRAWCAHVVRESRYFKGGDVSTYGGLDCSGAYPGGRGAEPLGVWPWVQLRPRRTFRSIRRSEAASSVKPSSSRRPVDAGNGVPSAADPPAVNRRHTRPRWRRNRAASERRFHDLDQSRPVAFVSGCPLSLPKSAYRAAQRGAFTSERSRSGNFKVIFGLTLEERGG